MLSYPIQKKGFTGAILTVQINVFCANVFLACLVFIMPIVLYLKFYINKDSICIFAFVTIAWNSISVVR